MVVGRWVSTMTGATGRAVVATGGRYSRLGAVVVGTGRGVVVVVVVVGTGLQHTPIWPVTEFWQFCSTIYDIVKKGTSRDKSP